MSTIITTFKVLFDILILAMLMKLTIRSREFFFNPLLRPVDFIAEPILKPLRKFVRPTETGWDYSPIVAICLCFLLLTVVVYAVSVDPILMSAIISSKLIIGFLFQVLTVSAIISVLITPYINNPLATFFSALLAPFEKLFAGRMRSRETRTGMAYLGIFLIMIVLWQAQHTLYHASSPRVVPSGGIPAALLTGGYIGVIDSLVSWQIWLYSVTDVLKIALSVYLFIVGVLMLSAVLTWANLNPRHPLIQIVYAISDPILIPIRRLLPSFGGLDLSPWVAGFAIIFASKFLTRLLNGLMTVVLKG